MINQEIIFKTDYLRGSCIDMLFRNMEENTKRKH